MRFVFDTYTLCIWAEYTVYMYEIHGVYTQNTKYIITIHNKQIIIDLYIRNYETTYDCLVLVEI